MGADHANIYDLTALYRRTIRSAGITGQVVTIQTDPLEPDIIRVLTHVTLENKTNSYTKARLLILHGGLEHYLDELTSIAAGELAVSRSDILLGQGDRFAAELTGTTTGDVLIFTLIGWDNYL